MFSNDFRGSLRGGRSILCLILCAIFVPQFLYRQEVNCVSNLPDDRLISGSWDKTLRIWETQTGQCLHILEGHSHSVSRICLLPGKGCCYVASGGSFDGTIRVWNSYTGKWVFTLEGHSGAINCICALGNDRIISGSSDKSVRVWDRETGSCLRVLGGHDDPVNSVQVLPDGRIVSGSEGDKIIILNSDFTPYQAVQQLILGDLEEILTSPSIPIDGLIDEQIDSVCLVNHSAATEDISLSKQFETNPLCNSSSNISTIVHELNENVTRIELSLQQLKLGINSIKALQGAQETIYSSYKKEAIIKCIFNYYYFNLLQFYCRNLSQQVKR